MMGANIYREDLEQCLYDEPELARRARSYCLGVYEEPDGSWRPLLSFEIQGDIDPTLQGCSRSGSSPDSPRSTGTFAKPWRSTQKGLGRSSAFTLLGQVPSPETRPRSSRPEYCPLQRVIKLDIAFTIDERHRGR